MTTNFCDLTRLDVFEEIKKGKVFFEFSPIFSYLLIFFEVDTRHRKVATFNYKEVELIIYDPRYSYVRVGQSNHIDFHYLCFDNKTKNNEMHYFKVFPTEKMMIFYDVIVPYVPVTLFQTGFDPQLKLRDYEGEKNKMNEMLKEFNKFLEGKGSELKKELLMDVMDMLQAKEEEFK